MVAAHGWPPSRKKPKGLRAEGELRKAALVMAPRKQKVREDTGRHRLPRYGPRPVSSIRTSLHGIFSYEFISTNENNIPMTQSPPQIPPLKKMSFIGVGHILDLNHDSESNSENKDDGKIHSCYMC